MKKVTNFCDFFIICSVSSQRRAVAVAEEIEEEFDRRGFPLRSSQGKREGLWILLDFSDVVMHIFLEEVRQYYALDRLWSDARRVHVPQN